MPSVAPFAMMTDPPATVANRAARILLFMPPVPRSLLVFPAIPAIESSMCATVSTSFAVGSWRGSAEYKPSTFVSKISSGACSKFATIAASWSLSPNLISAMLTVSFSLMIGSAEYSNNVMIVFRIFR